MRVRWLRWLRRRCGATTGKAEKTVTCGLRKNHQGYHCGLLLDGLWHWRDDAEVS